MNVPLEGKRLSPLKPADANSPDLIAARLPGRWLLLGSVVVAFAGLYAAGTLTAAHLLDLPVPCGRSQGCATVAQHPSSRFFGIPIAGFGMGAYIALLVAFTRPALSRGLRVAVVALTGLGAVISAGLLVYAHLVIRATCSWCGISGVAMTALFLASLLLVRSSGPIPGFRPALGWAGGLATAIALGVQVGLMQRAALTPPIPARMLAGLPRSEVIDSMKSLGPADAPVTIVEFADLSCGACRRSYEALIKYQAAHPRSVRLVFRHLPLWQIQGHEFSRAAAAVSEMMAENGAFWPFLAELFPHFNRLDRDVLRRVARQFGMDPDEVEARLSDPSDRSIQRVMQDEALAERLGINQTPTFLVLVEGQPLVAANERLLSRWLNSPLVVGRLAQAAHTPVR